MSQLGCKRELLFWVVKSLTLSHDQDVKLSFFTSFLFGQNPMPKDRYLKTKSALHGAVDKLAKGYSLLQFSLPIKVPIIPEFAEFRLPFYLEKIQALSPCRFQSFRID